MDELMYQSMDFGITCIDAAYVRHGTACFYLLEENGEYAVLETGTSRSVPALQQLLANRGIACEQVRYVIPTHVHLDHAGGAGAMMAVFPAAQLLIHPRGARHMADPERLIAAATQVYGEALFDELYGEIKPVDPGRIRQMLDGETISLAGRSLEFRHVRGHAEHHFCVWDGASQGWFSGDMFGICYPWFRLPGGDFVLPSTTPAQFDPECYLASLELLGSYKPQRMYLTHYGELQYSPEQARSLAQQIEAYRVFATADPVGVVQLQEQLADHAVQIMHQFGANSSEAELRSHLNFDMQLNAQGLRAWQNRVGGG